MPQPLRTTVREILADSNSLSVPFYQRDYEWDIESQIKPFEASFSNQASEIPIKENTETFLQPLYLGALVLDPKKIGHYEKISGDYRIVDGQQRLVTLNLLLCALRDNMANLEQYDSQDILCINNILFQTVGSNSGKAKLIPNVANRVLFDKIITRTNDSNFNNIKSSLKDYFKKNNDELKFTKDFMPPRLLSAYVCFYNEINSLVVQLKNNTNEGEITIILKNYLKAILDAVVIVIFLEEKDDTQSFFKSLNSGKPLTAFELVKNDVLMRAEANQAGSGEVCFKNQWIYFENSTDSEYWKLETSIAKHKLPNSNWFLYYYLSAVTGSHTIRVDRLVHEYGQFLKKTSEIGEGSKPFNFSKVEDEVENFVTYAKTYRKMTNKQQIAETHNLEPIVEFFHTARRFKSETQFYPFALRLWNSDLSTDDKKKIFRIIISFMVRRHVVKTPVGGINKMFLDLIRLLDSSGWSRENFVQKLLEFKSESSIFPTNEQFMHKWLNEPTYQQLDSQVIQYILESIEKGHIKSTYEAGIQFSPSENSIEHFMPQSWREDWRIRFNGSDYPVTEEEYNQSKQSGGGEDDSLMGRIRRRERLLHNFGNLTVLTSRTNSAASKNSFESKKVLLEANTTMMMNRGFSKKSKWDEEDIEARSKELFAIAVKIWPHPYGL